ncbi:predicted protein [Naegleria gruberi]|uniref:Predicted protein n=1 Tax=Naegleria gruberi TaxID=5762 RepID=D2W4L8_NAEGR|nr:uncharacterized protein NAEGRDRAFT_76352 [Naegleria gruberi]EFC35985.1 predicted protein [Naegleria gruberi]|eukprot:XP_002668729.1 predicted protein [Naegleria gruberi strain NEG-M]
MPFYRALYSNVPKITLGEKLLLWIKEKKNGKKKSNQEMITFKETISVKLRKHLHTIKQTLFNSKLDMSYTPQNNSNQEQVNNEETCDNNLVNQEHVYRLNAIFLLIGYLILLAIFEGLCGIVMAFKIISISRGYFICITIAYLITSFAFITILCMIKKEKKWLGFIIQIIIMFVSFCVIVGSFTYVWIVFNFQPYSY